MQRKAALNEQNEAIKEHKKKVQVSMMEKRSSSGSGKKREKTVPLVAQSAKFLVAEKKEAEKAMKAAEKAAK